MTDRVEIIADSWLSSVLSCPAFHLVGKITGLSSDQLPKTPCFLDAKVPVTDLAGCHFLESLGFRLADTNMQYAGYLGTLKTGSQRGKIRQATPDDAGRVASIARKSMQSDRFHKDSLIPPSVADEIKERWVANFFLGTRGDWMIVAEINNHVVGFLQLLKGAQGQLVVDLIGVDESARRQGLAGAMIAFAVTNCTPGAEIQVGTQIANYGSIRLYEGLGLRLHSAQHVFHWHGRDVDRHLALH